MILYYSLLSRAHQSFRLHEEIFLLCKILLLFLQSFFVSSTFVIQTHVLKSIFLKIYLPQVFFYSLDFSFQKFSFILRFKAYKFIASKNTFLHKIINVITYHHFIIIIYCVADFLNFAFTCFLCLKNNLAYEISQPVLPNNVKHIPFSLVSMKL